MLDPLTQHFIQMFFWGLLVLLSFTGWGKVVHHFLYTPTSTIIPKHIDWGLLSGWGMVLTLIIGGILNVFALVSVSVLITYIVVGALIGGITLYRNRPVLPKFSFFQIAISSSLIIVLLFFYAQSIQLQSTSCADDEIAYIPSITRMLQTGTLVDPFSLRRIASFGGQTFLQSLIATTGDENNANLMDRGVAVLICFGLIIGYFRTWQEPKLNYALPLIKAAILLMIIALLPFPFLNSASRATGLAIFIVLFRTLDLTDNTQAPNYRVLWLIAAIVAASATLRPHFLMAAALSVTLYWFLCWWRTKRHAQDYIISLVHVGLTSLALLIPWMMTLQLSSNTPVYPLFKGNHRQEFEAYSAGMDPAELFRFIVDIMIEPRMVLMWIPICMLMIYKHSKPALSLCLASVVTSFAIVAAFSLSDISNLHRYVAPFVNAGLIVTVMSFIRHSTGNLTVLRTLTLSSRAIRIVLISVAVILMPPMIVKTTRTISYHWDRPILSTHMHDLYDRMQSTVPEGAGILAMVFHPFAWDYTRNNIANIDIPGVVSPDPGMPLFKGPEALKKYLVDLSLPYLAIGNFNEPGQCLYYRRFWEFQRDTRFSMWQALAPNYLDFMESAEALEKSNPVIFREKGFRVIKLQ